MATGAQTFLVDLPRCIQCSSPSYVFGPDASSNGCACNAGPKCHLPPSAQGLSKEPLATGTQHSSTVVDATGHLSSLGKTNRKDVQRDSQENQAEPLVHIHHHRSPPRQTLSHSCTALESDSKLGTMESRRDSKTILQDLISVSGTTWVRTLPGGSQVHAVGLEHAVGLSPARGLAQKALMRESKKAAPRRGVRLKQLLHIATALSDGNSRTRVKFRRHADGNHH